jgi:hypothetical protein
MKAQRIPVLVKAYAVYFAGQYMGWEMATSAAGAVVQWATRHNNGDENLVEASLW